MADGNCWMAQNLAYEIKANVSAIGSRNDRSTFTYTPSTCAASGICSLNGNTFYSAKYSQEYYSWVAAVADSWDGVLQRNDVDGSVCPVGWRIPSNYLATRNFDNLISMAYGITALSSLPILKNYPLDYGPTERSYGGKNTLSGETTYGFWWTSSALSIEGYNAAYSLYYSSDTLDVGNNSHGSKIQGFSLRCVAL